MEHVTATVPACRHRVTECVPVGHFLEADEFAADIAGLIHQDATDHRNTRPFGALVARLVAAGVAVDRAGYSPATAGPAGQQRVARPYAPRAMIVRLFTVYQPPYSPVRFTLTSIFIGSNYL